MSSHCLRGPIASDEESTVNLIKVSFYVMNCFSLAAFKILSLFLAFNNLNVMCLGVDFFEVILLGDFEIFGCVQPIFPSIGDILLSALHILFLIFVVDNWTFKMI